MTKVAGKILYAHGSRIEFEAEAFSHFDRHGRDEIVLENASLTHFNSQGGKHSDAVRHKQIAFGGEGMSVTFSDSKSAAAWQRAREAAGRK